MSISRKQNPITRSYTRSRASRIRSAMYCLSSVVVAFPCHGPDHPLPRLVEWIGESTAPSSTKTMVTSKFPVTPASTTPRISIRSFFPFPNSCLRKSRRDRKYRPYPHPPQYWICVVRTFVSRRPLLRIIIVLMCPENILLRSAMAPQPLPAEECKHGVAAMTIEVSCDGSLTEMRHVAIATPSSR